MSMKDPIVVAGAKYKHGEVKRDPRIPWKDQIDSIAEDYEGFDWTSVSGGWIRFIYLRKKEGVA